MLSDIYFAWFVSDTKEHKGKLLHMTLPPLRIELCQEHFF